MKLLRSALQQGARSHGFFFSTNFSIRVHGGGSTTPLHGLAPRDFFLFTDMKIAGIEVEWQVMLYSSAKVEFRKCIQ